MLTFIDILPVPRGFRMKRKAKRGKIPPRQTIHKIRNKNFRVIKIVDGSNGIVNTQISSLINPGDTIILQDTGRHFDIDPDNYGCLLELSARQLVNFTVVLMKSVSRNKRFRILLIDRKGRCMGAAAELIPYCDVTIFTDNPEKYDMCIDYTRLKYGAEPIAVSNTSHIGHVDFALAPYGLENVTIPNSSTPLFSSLSSDKGYYICKELLNIPNDISKATPDGFSPEIFAAATFCEYEFEEFFYLCPQGLNFKNNFVKLSEIENYILNC